MSASVKKAAHTCFVYNKLAIHLKMNHFEVLNARVSIQVHYQHTGIRVKIQNALVAIFCSIREKKTMVFKLNLPHFLDGRRWQSVQISVSCAR